MNVVKAIEIRNSTHIQLKFFSIMTMNDMYFKTQGPQMSFSEVQMNVYLARCHKVLQNNLSSQFELAVAEMILARIQNAQDRKASTLKPSQG